MIFDFYATSRNHPLYLDSFQLHHMAMANHTALDNMDTALDHIWVPVMDHHPVNLVLIKAPMAQGTVINHILHLPEALITTTGLQDQMDHLDPQHLAMVRFN